jgi:hypothetical protein
VATLTTFTANTQIKSAEVNGNFTGLSDGTMDIDHNSLQIFRDEALYDFVNSGGVWTGDSVGVNRNASMTALVTTIDGWRSSIGAVTSRTFTASKDTYVDVLRTTTTTALVYTEVTNNAASPALAANSLRLAIVVTGATTIAAAASINQGQEDRILPIASSVAYSVTDSLGNLICNRTATPTLIGFRRITVSPTQTATSATQITGLSAPAIVPTGRKIKVKLKGQDLYHSIAGDAAIATLWDGTVGSGTQLDLSRGLSNAGGGASVCDCEAITTPATNSKTYNAGLHAGVAGTATIDASATSPLILLVELV